MNLVRAATDEVQCAVIDAATLDHSLTRASVNALDQTTFFRFLAVRLCDRLRSNNLSSLGQPERASIAADDPHAAGGIDALRDMWGRAGGAAAFCQQFNIHASEYVLNNAYAAVVQQGARPLWGVIAVTQSYVCFRGELFGQTSCFAFHFAFIQNLTQVEHDGAHLLEMLVEPRGPDESEEERRFTFVFYSPEDCAAFVADVAGAHSAESVWRQSRGRIRTSYKVEQGEEMIFATPTERLQSQRSLPSQHASSHTRKRSMSFRWFRGAQLGAYGGECQGSLSGDGGDRARQRAAPETNEGMARLVEGARTLTFAKDETIIHEGNRDVRLYQIGIGRVRVETGPVGATRRLATLYPGQVLGEVALLSGGPASASVVADLPDTTIYAFDASRLASSLVEDARVGRRSRHETEKLRQIQE
ncbi:hypothetical protein T484DRAFT_1878856 [Baffinella frigidus]|nr:hypothetical protein T484DRAFT_1878856 [Cryptophyta sp. CCMP2293]